MNGQLLPSAVHRMRCRAYPQPANLLPQEIALNVFVSDALLFFPTIALHFALAFARPALFLLRCPDAATVATGPTEATSSAGGSGSSSPVRLSVRRQLFLSGLASLNSQLQSAHDCIAARVSQCGWSLGQSEHQDAGLIPHCACTAFAQRRS